MTTPQVQITYDEALDLLQRAVAEKGPEFNYHSTEEYGNDGCRYFYHGKPSCIVGHVLAYKDVPTSLIEDCNNFFSVGGLVNWGIVGADEKAVRLLSVAQTEQDEGEDWGDALAVAIWSVETGNDPEENPYLQDAEDK